MVKPYLHTECRNSSVEGGLVTVKFWVQSPVCKTLNANCWDGDTGDV